MGFQVKTTQRPEKEESHNTLGQRQIYLICEDQGILEQIYTNANILIHLVHKNIVYLHMNKCAKRCCMKKGKCITKMWKKGSQLKAFGFIMHTNVSIHMYLNIYLNIFCGEWLSCSLVRQFGSLIHFQMDFFLKHRNNKLE